MLYQEVIRAMTRAKGWENWFCRRFAQKNLHTAFFKF